MNLHLLIYVKYHKVEKIVHSLQKITNVKLIKTNYISRFLMLHTTKKLLNLFRKSNQ